LINSRGVGEKLHENTRTFGGRTKNHGETHFFLDNENLKNTPPLIQELKDKFTT